MSEKNKNPKKSITNKNKKTAGNNQWTSTGLKPTDDKRERRDGPGGEDGK